MSYVRPFTYFVGAAGGPLNLLLCGICNLIPVVGQIALLGYRAEVAEELVRDPDLRQHPAFDFGRFIVYLGRGVRPFAYQFAAAVVVAAALLGGAVLANRLLDANARSPDPYLFAMLVALGYLLLVLVTAVVTAMLLWPMELHAQLGGRFAPLAALGFARRFQGKVWGQSLVSLVVFLVGSFFVGLAGVLALGVGIYLAVVVQFMAQQHLVTQLYRLYLDVGGDPIHGADDEYDDGTD